MGELPPPAPRACFGHDQLIENLVSFAANLKPIALIGPGGIGKTTIALTVLHHDRIKNEFGHNRRFIHCDRFPASCSEFLARLSKVIGAGVEYPESLVPLLPSLSSQQMIIALDNVESVLDTQGTNTQEIRAVIDELCLLETICLFVVSRTATVPQQCKRLVIPKLSRTAACDIFYNIYSDCRRSDAIDGLLQHLDPNPLSITLLATTASQNTWDYNQLVCHDPERFEGTP